MEDDADLGATVEQELRDAHLDATWVRSAEAGLEQLTKSIYDICILDVNLGPGMNGFTAIERIRKSGSHTPVLMLTARNSVEDKVKGLRLGADDYLTKPFAFKELLARLDALFRRAPKRTDAVKIGRLTIDPLRHNCTTADGTELELSARQFALMELLARNVGTVVTRQHVLSDVFGYTFTPSANIVDVHVSHLRSKLARVASGVTITTVRGVGYRLDETTGE
ncbi:MAG: response regulator transcription factor [Myxococcaceae bacterium]